MWSMALNLLFTDLKIMTLNVGVAQLKRVSVFFFFLFNYNNICRDSFTDHIFAQISVEIKQYILQKYP